MKATDISSHSTLLATLKSEFPKGESEDLIKELHEMIDDAAESGCRFNPAPFQHTDPRAIKCTCGHEDCFTGLSFDEEEPDTLIMRMHHGEHREIIMRLNREARIDLAIQLFSNLQYLRKKVAYIECLKDYKMLYFENLFIHKGDRGFVTASPEHYSFSPQKGICPCIALEIALASNHFNVVFEDEQ